MKTTFTSGHLFCTDTHTSKANRVITLDATSTHIDNDCLVTFDDQKRTTNKTYTEASQQEKTMRNDADNRMRSPAQSRAVPKAPQTESRVMTRAQRRRADEMGDVESADASKTLRRKKAQKVVVLSPDEQAPAVVTDETLGKQTKQTKVAIGPISEIPAFRDRAAERAAAAEIRRQTNVVSSVANVLEQLRHENTLKQYDDKLVTNDDILSEAPDGLDSGVIPRQTPKPKVIE
jgi:hypothetical protein